MVKVAGMPEAGLTFQAPALCFDNEEDCFEAVTKRRYAEGCVGHGGSEAAVGGPIARVRDGDIIEIDAINDRIDLLVEDLELEKRKKDWQLRKLISVLARYGNMPRVLAQPQRWR
jgi:dihydroxy-acid dehydratase